ncbi:MAG: nucleoside deaminase [Myxococcales bacterium]
MDEGHLRTAIELAQQNAKAGGRPFGAVLVRDQQVIGRGVNNIARTLDPTTHAEVEALRAACKSLQQVRLPGSIMYASGHPCPMCLAAMHLCRVERVFYAYDQRDAEPYGLSTEALYAELRKPLPEQSMPVVHLPLRVEGLDPYATWRATQTP